MSRTQGSPAAGSDPIQGDHARAPEHTGVGAAGRYLIGTQFLYSVPKHGEKPWTCALGVIF